jgi:RimJ/RimL family protein N-acetyltransferase
MEEWQYYDEPYQPFKSVDREEFEAKLRQPSKITPGSHRWIIDSKEGRPLGWINYYNLDTEQGNAYIGIVLPEEDNWGKGYGTEAIKLLVAHLFESMNLIEIKTVTWSGNERMMRCAEKVGFRELHRKPHPAGVSIRGESLERVEFTISKSNLLV